MVSCFVRALLAVVGIIVLLGLLFTLVKNTPSLHAAQAATPSYLGFTYNDGKITIAGQDLATLVENINQKSIGGIDQRWTLTGVKFKNNTAGIETGVYALLANTTETACQTACAAAPLCRLYEVDVANSTCKLSTTNLRNIQTLYGQSLFAKNSPLEKSASSTIHVLLRRPIIVTSLHDSACDCNTRCALHEVRHENWPADTGSGQCVGTLNHKGEYVNTCTGFTTHPQRLVEYQQQLATNNVVGRASTALPMFATPTTAKTQLQQFQEAVHQSFCVCMWDPSGVPRGPLPTHMLNIINLSCPYRIPDVTTLLTDLANVDV